MITMSDSPSPEHAPHAEAGTPNTVVNISGGVNFGAQHNVNDAVAMAHLYATARDPQADCAAGAEIDAGGIHGN
jgi:hypothetical protein